MERSAIPIFHYGDHLEPSMMWAQTFHLTSRRRPLLTDFLQRGRVGGPYSASALRSINGHPVILGGSENKHQVANLLLTHTMSITYPKNNKVKSKL